MIKWPHVLFLVLLLAVSLTDSAHSRKSRRSSASSDKRDTEIAPVDSVPIVQRLIYCLLEPNRYTWVFVMTLIVSFISAMAIGIFDVLSSSNLKEIYSFLFEIEVRTTSSIHLLTWSQPAL